uniref:Guanine nucleotide-binding protein subunit beta-like protein n=1 Tax=Eutreptiella gymnastica TaxID=73025 RepID=A0A7S1IXT9_9EUGL
MVVDKERRKLYTGTTDGVLSAWDLDHENPRNGASLFSQPKEDKSSVSAMLLLPDGTVASGHENGKIFLWDPKARAVRYTLPGHKKAINGLAFYPVTQSLFSSSRDGTVRRWGLKPRKGQSSPESKIFVAKGMSPFAVQGLAILEDKLFYVPHHEDGAEEYHVQRLTIGDDGPKSSKQADAKPKAEAKGKAEKEDSDNDDTDTEGEKGGSDVEQKEDTGPEDVKVEEEADEGPMLLSGHKGLPTLLVVAGGKLYSGSDDMTIKVWNVDGKEACRPFRGVRKQVLSLDVSDKRLCAASADMSVREWDLESGAPTNVFIHNELIGSLVVHDKKMYVACNGGWVRVVNLAKKTNADDVAASRM